MFYELLNTLHCCCKKKIEFKHLNFLQKSIFNQSFVEKNLLSNQTHRSVPQSINSFHYLLELIFCVEMSQFNEGFKIGKCAE